MSTKYQTKYSTESENDRQDQVEAYCNRCIANGHEAELEFIILQALDLGLVAGEHLDAWRLCR